MKIAGTIFLLFLASVLTAPVLLAQNEEWDKDIPYFEEQWRNESATESKQVRNRRSQNRDTIVVIKNNLPDPIKAALLSAALPGLGQIYNKSYWKVPVVYGGLMSLGYLVHYFDYNYIKFRNAFLAHNDGNPNTINPYESDWRITGRLFDRIEFHRRNRDYLMILTAGAYLLNIVEAHVDAHLQSFDLSDDISMNFRPTIIPTPHTTVIGLSLNITFK